MSPTVFRERGYRFYFFSREERKDARSHLLRHGDEVLDYRSRNYRLSQLREIGQIEEHYDELSQLGKIASDVEVTNISTRSWPVELYQLPPPIVTGSEK